MITKIYNSPLKNKRFRVEIKTKDGIETFDFGLRDGYTFIDGATDIAKKNYLKRHMGNATENRLIRNAVPSASLLSAKLLWGPTRDLGKNVIELNKMWKD
jgi:hypothetical protein